MANFGERLREYRESKGMTNRQAAKLFQISSSTLAETETGEHEPSSRTINKIINNSDINPTWLHTGEGSMIKKNDSIKQNLIPRGSEQPEFKQKIPSKEELKKLKELYEDGLITEEQYTKKVNKELGID